MKRSLSRKKGLVKTELPNIVQMWGNARKSEEHRCLFVLESTLSKNKHTKFRQTLANLIPCLDEKNTKLRQARTSYQRVLIPTNNSEFLGPLNKMKGPEIRPLEGIKSQMDEAKISLKIRKKDFRTPFFEVYSS